MIETAGDLREEPVARLVAHAVGDDTQAVDIDGKDSAAAFCLTVAHRSQDAVEAREESIAQHQAGDGIAGFIGLALSFLGLAAGDVADEADATDGFALRVRHAACAQLDPAEAALCVAHAHLERERRIALTAVRVDRVGIELHVFLRDEACPLAFGLTDGTGLQPQERFDRRRDEQRVGFEVPIPQALVCGGETQRVAVFDLARLALFGGDLLRLAIFLGVVGGDAAGEGQRQHACGQQRVADERQVGELLRHLCREQARHHEGDQP
ncbi:MAG: hypothetical protein MZV49_11220 [Rhodopseudomonas palustris]|nr:hypothetical protein [Rhodopseudomonas palustris]